MFDRRHLEFLARFAGRNLSPADTAKLIAAIAAEMPSFRADLFTAAADKVRPRKRQNTLHMDQAAAESGGFA